MSVADTSPAVRIAFCFECGFTRRANKLAGDVMEEFGDFLPGGVTIVPGEREIFDVWLDDRLLFSRKKAGRFPNEREVEDQLIEILEG
ncbi:MAG: Rdx family protein [Thermomicrobiales bacterium]|nr:Rdx family protein [Thermomicrobiales bacterium]